VKPHISGNKVVRDATAGILPKARNVRRRQLQEREILAVADHEKERVGRELHDGLCQSLAGIAALSSALSRRLAVGAQPGPAAAANEIVRLLNEAVGEARPWSWSNQPKWRRSCF
jgi:signal transduction histidine kinase